MICDFCGERQANVHLTEVINDQSRELHLCEICAKEKGIGPGQELELSGLLAGLTDLGSTLRTAARKQVCPTCGMSYEQFRKSGRLGCARCYQTFEKFLTPLLRRIHGSIQHVGKRPNAGTDQIKPASIEQEMAHLKEQLKQAVTAERYEEAALLRDRIRLLKNKTPRRR